MRLWSIHPKYLDVKGLTAVWREALLAQKVLIGKTKGYKTHPQLERFKSLKSPIEAIGTYLCFLYDEANKRGYSFNSGKILKVNKNAKMAVNRGQIVFEWNHFKKKVKARDKKVYREIRKIKMPDANPLFIVIKGKKEKWEKAV